MQQEEPHFLVKHVSLGDVLVLVSSLIVFAFGYGRLSRDVEALTRAMQELQARDITPGARAQLASIQATDQSLQAQVNDLREELRESRRELLEEVRSISRKLDEHDKGR